MAVIELNRLLDRILRPAGQRRADVDQNPTNSSCASRGQDQKREASQRVVSRAEQGGHAGWRAYIARVRATSRAIERKTPGGCVRILRVLLAIAAIAYTRRIRAKLDRPYVDVAGTT